ncbi:MAG: DUF3341 domain-containing protein [Cytophagales bacterium]|nr:MAG: DUF3341 domain-containing protein [Cytophagales bacterium]
MLQNKTKKYLVGIYNDENVLISAIKKLKGENVSIEEVYTPYPVHHLDEYLGHKRSRLSKAAFLFGATGTLTAITIQTYTMGLSWPMIIGGKDYISPPSFVPVSFELTVLFAAFGMVITFLLSNNLLPWRYKPFMFDPRSTDDKFVMAIDMESNSKSEDEISQLLKNTGAESVDTKEKPVSNDL